VKSFEQKSNHSLNMELFEIKNDMYRLKTRIIWLQYDVQYCSSAIWDKKVRLFSAGNLMAKK
jgi:hypothetical protein